MKKITYFLVFIFTFSSFQSHSQHSIAREWNEQLLDAIRIDFARPTVHARNLFHTSMLMYDAWAIFDEQAETVFLGKSFRGFDCPFSGIDTPTDIDAARHEVISYAMFRLLSHRFQNSPGSAESLASFSSYLASLGYDENFTSTDYSTGSYAALGNYLASEIIAFGLQDGSHEQSGYNNLYYDSVNEPLVLELYEDNTGIDPNRWQPLAFDVFIDQSGNVYPLNTPDFVSPEWGEVAPFSLTTDELEILNNGFDSYLYHNPGDPAYIQNSNEDGFDDPYKWYFTLVASWSSHLDPDDTTLIDISPNGLGNVDFADLPQTFEEFRSFYDYMEGGDPGSGHALNPYTNAPYTPQMVKRGDYTRVLAEFWADGPNSETPPGHWFTIMNYVSDHPLVVKRINGQGPVVSDLEWDVKCYLALGGAMHDCAVTTWGIKGYYDYIRPISAIRYMAGKGQSSDMSLPNYDPHGIPLVPGRIELIESGDPLAGDSDENVGRVKIYAWRGPDFIADPDVDIAGVDWVLGEHWWPYQRPTFVTPPFAGYVSGHSTFSRAAAEVLTLLTGDAFFPGGMGTFDVVQNEFLVFEEGPSETFQLQWATYRDASEQTSLSRIWGGIHPPIDDIPGRIIGAEIGVEAYTLAEQYFNATLSTEEVVTENSIRIYPNPFSNDININNYNNQSLSFQLYGLDGKLIHSENSNNNPIVTLKIEGLQSGLYLLKVFNENNDVLTIEKLIKN